MSTGINRDKVLFFIVMVAVAAFLIAVPQSHGARWLKNSIELEQDGYRLELFSQKKIATRAFIQGRGFNAKDSQFYSQNYCVFGSAQGNILTNKNAPSVEINLDKWRVNYQGKEQSLVTRQDWEKIWQQRGVSEDLRTSFFWTLFPTRQKYAPTDYNWGGIIVALPAGAKFDLRLWWKKGKTEYSALVKGLLCRD